MADTKVYKLQSSDDKVVEVTDSFIQRSVTLNNMLQGTRHPLTTLSPLSYHYRLSLS
jgi:hypothetical protein